MIDDKTKERFEFLSGWLEQIKPPMWDFQWLNEMDIIHSGVHIARESTRPMGYPFDRGDAFNMQIPNPTTDFNFAIGLHELGHIFGNRPDGLGASETDAWKWARENAPYWNEDMSKAAEVGLNTHLDHQVTRKDYIQFFQWLRSKDESGKAQE